MNNANNELLIRVIFILCRNWTGKKLICIGLIKRKLFLS